MSTDSPAAPAHASKTETETETPAVPQARVLVDPYRDWSEAEGIPIHLAFGHNLLELETGPWDRYEAKGCFAHTHGAGDFMANCVLEVAPGAKARPVRHLYEVFCYVLAGHGSTKVCLPGGEVRTFEWGPKAMFAIPLNCRYQIFNATAAQAVPRPLATQQFLTNGVGLFVEHAGELLNVSEQGQQALREDFAQALARIEFGGHGGPVLLFSFTRNASPRDEQPRSVVVDPARSFGRPVVAGAYVRTEVVVQRFRAGDTIAEMADDYAVPMAVIEEALRFEHRSAA